MKPSLIESVRHAMAQPATVAAAREADAMWRDWCAARQPRVPGIDTVMRLAVRIDCGATVEQAAAREYLYRWGLVLLQWVNFAETDKPRSRHSARRVNGAWSVPHAIGLDGI